ncbi:MAG TPA: ABC transporter permease [Gaiellaceae bacterium]|jgi:ribose transport system permease protein|nr:ABC transporter permease [Gaiellaceae bacterium]
MTNVAQPIDDSPLGPAPGALRGGAAVARFLLIVSRYATLIALLVMCVVFSIHSPRSFFTVDNFLNILNQSSLTALIAGGLTVTLIVGEFDLSIGYAASLAGVLVAGLMSHQGLSIPLAVLATIGVGAGIGAVNGVLVAKARINSVVATLGIGTVLVGVSYTYTNGQPIAAGMPLSFLNFAVTKFLHVPKPMLVAAGVLALLWVIINLTDLGQRLQAVGGNAEAARLAGIAVDRVKIFAFVISGACAALTGVLLSSLIGSGTIAAADSYLLAAFAAVFLGSTTLRDGEFHIVGTVVGVIFINTGINGLSIFGVPTSYQNIFTGGILVVAVGLSTVTRRYTTR